MNKFVGLQKIEISDKQKEITFPLLVLYPTQAPSRPVAFGPFSLDVSVGVEPAGEKLPLVVISHGSGGSYMAYRTYAHYLAQQGFVVLLPEHYANHRLDNSGEGTLENMQDRPRHVSLAIDAIYAHKNFAKQLKPDSVGIIGHSMGGHTALALAGGIPHTRHLIEYCEKEENKHSPPCIHMKESRRIAQQVEIIPDSRVKALVLFDPAVMDYSSSDALQNISIPIFLLSAGADPSAIAQAKIIESGLPNKELLTARIVENANHYSFLSPFPAILQSRLGPAAKDPEGFDREAFHHKLNQEIFEFFSRI